MKENNKNFEECMEEMDSFVTSFAELDIMEYCSAEDHYALANALAAIVADMGEAESFRSTFKHFSRWLAVVVFRAEEEAQDWEDVEYLARDLVHYLPEGWQMEDVEGLWERAVDVARGTVPTNSLGLAMA